jgi:hypothetical protein
MGANRIVASCPGRLLLPLSLLPSSARVCTSYRVPGILAAARARCTPRRQTMPAVPLLAVTLAVAMSSCQISAQELGQDLGRGSLE